MITKREVGKKNNLLFAFATHDGYSKKFYGLLHSRCINLSDHSLKILDQLSQQALAHARFHLHPDICVKITGDNNGLIITRDGQVLNWVFSGASNVKLLDSNWHPEFGLTIPNKCLVAEFDGQFCEFFVKW